MSKTMARNAAHDAGIGAILGLLLVSGLVTANLDIRQLVVDGREPFGSLASIISVVVAQCAMAATFCGVFVRKFSASEAR
jgi:hypothetical protein